MNLSTVNALRQELQAIYDIHQEGILAFEQGTYEVSRKKFTEAFGFVSRALRKADRPEVLYFKGSPLVKETKSSPDFCDSSDLPHAMQDDEEQGQLHHKMSSIASVCGDLPIHPRVLRFPEQCSINQFAFVTLYNLTLSTHIVALTCNADTSMRQAARLWEIVYSFQWRQSLNLKPVHSLAILVSLGHAQDIAGNKLGSKKGFENVLSAIQILDGRKQQVPNKSFFLYSAFRMLRTDAVSAASAA